METILCAIAGWLIGVFINRAADNLPARKTWYAAMRCATCGTPLAFGSEVALAGLATHGGHCPQCQAKVRVRPPLVLVANAAAFAFLWLRFGPGASLPPQATYTSLPLAAIYTSLLLLILVTDLEHRLIFNAVIFPAIALAALASNWSAIGWRRALLGGILALVIVLGIYYLGKLFERLRGLHIAGGAFGQGDVTLATFIGLITGFPAVTSALLYGILFGGVGATALLAYHGVAHRRLALDVVFAYGPFLCIAGWLAMVWPV